MKVNIQKDYKNIKRIFIKPEDKEDQKMLKEWVKLLKKIK